VGFANKAVWRIMKLETLVWASMNDDTVRYANDGAAALSIGPMIAPKIEPEVVFKLKSAVSGDPTMQRLCLGPSNGSRSGFETIDSPYPEWKVQPVDFVAAYGLPAALVVGEPRSVAADEISTLAEELPKFTLKLTRIGGQSGELVEERCGVRRCALVSSCQPSHGVRIRNLWRQANWSARGR
jgi:2-keto-4-pentenoate hydratase